MHAFASVGMTQAKLGDNQPEKSVAEALPGAVLKAPPMTLPMLALPPVTEAAFVLTAEILAQGCAAARASARQRIILPLHRTQAAPVQRMLNFLQPGTYIQPHLHPLQGASETIQVLQGRIGFLIFNEQGSVQQTALLQAGPLGMIDIEPNLWHGFVALEPDTVILEVKRGPYDGAGDKVFAPWAPREADAECGAAEKEWCALFE
jgi:cupin fold WbuC family metalloprotein